jgi:hypothetical protein
MRRFTCIVTLLGLCCLRPSTVQADVIVADDFLYSQPTKAFGPGGGFTRQDYGGGQNGPAGFWGGRWVSSGDGIITGADVADVELEEDLFITVLGNTFSPTDTFIQRTYSLDNFSGNTLYFAVDARSTLDGLEAPRMYIHNPLNEENQIAIGFEDFGIIAQLGFDSDVNLDEETNTGEFHRLIGKLELNASGNRERLTVWVNPTGVEQGTSAVIENDVIESFGDLSGLLRLSRVGPGSRAYFDNVAMGTTWDDVAVVDIPRLSLVIDETSGSAALVNETSQPFDLHYYELESASGGLAFAGWNSLADQGQAGWLENAASGSLIVESNFGSSTMLAPGASLPLGGIAAGGVSDLVARYGTTDGLLNVALISFGSVGPIGDFNGDGVLDASDIDLLSAEVRAGTNTASFDLNNDGVVNNDDRIVMVESLLGTFFGDSNLDGEFNSGDFVTVFTAGEYEDGISSNSTWATGDWNGDGEFDSSDFVTAFTTGGYEQGPRAAVAAVPEPASFGTFLVALGMLAISRRRAS